MMSVRNQGIFDCVSGWLTSPLTTGGFDVQSLARVCANTFDV
jgi:hypothetical protein